MHRLPIILFIPFLVAMSQTARADCLEISDPQFDIQRAEFGGLEVEWWTRIENRCDTTIDADLSIQFLDKTGKSVYEVRHLSALSPRETSEAGKQFYMPSRYYDTITDIDIKTEERKRSF